MHVCCRSRAGFTLIEMAVVILIIGLLIGGILVGQDLIGSAAIRAQISQIDKYNAAASNFFRKYGYLPGDIPDPFATRFNFSARGSNPGQGDGNGVIQSWCPNQGTIVDGAVMTGEEGTFWVDLSTDNLIEGGFKTAGEAAYPATNLSGTALDAYMPHAKIMPAAYVVVGGFKPNATTIASGNGAYSNWFFVTLSSQADNCYNYGASGGYAETTAFTVAQAYAIDKKIDDGFPTTGSVQALLFAVGPYWSAPVSNQGYSQGAFYVAYPGSATTCMDDNNSLSNPWLYSLRQNKGAGRNCGLGFEMQAGGGAGR